MKKLNKISRYMVEKHSAMTLFESNIMCEPINSFDSKYFWQIQDQWKKTSIYLNKVKWKVLKVAMEERKQSTYSMDKSSIISKDLISASSL